MRPRGWFEVRYLDAQSAPWWPVPVVVLGDLVEPAPLAGVVSEACADVSGCWLRAARHGLDDARIARAVRAVFESVVDHVADPALRETVAGFVERYVSRSRCPADDVLDGYTPTAPPHPTRS